MTFDSRALNMLDAKLIAELNTAHETLGSGIAIIQSDAAATGMKCAQTIGRIAGLKAAREFIQQIEEELSGRKEKKKEIA